MHVDVDEDVVTCCVVRCMQQLFIGCGYVNVALIQWACVCVFNVSVSAL